jgi:hypothetical protein
MSMDVPYRRVFTCFWRDEKVRLLSGDEQRIALYCLTGPQSNRIGYYILSPGAAAEDLGMVPETFAKGFGRVCRNLSWRFDFGSRALLIPSWWKWNAPDNENQLIGNLKDLAGMPQTPLYKEFLKAETLPQRLRQTFLERCPKPCPRQEQEQEQEQDIKKLMSEDSDELLFENSFSGFDRFWSAWPKHTRKTSKKQCLSVWKKKKLESRADHVIAVVEVMKESDEWKNDKGQYIPAPLVWLNQDRYDCEISDVENVGEQDEDVVAKIQRYREKMKRDGK